MTQHTLFEVFLVLLAVFSSSHGFRSKTMAHRIVTKPNSRYEFSKGNRRSPWSRRGNSKSSQTKSYTCDADQTHFTVTPATADKNKWFDKMFRMASQEKLGVGQDVQPGRAHYDQLVFKAAWKVAGENDVKRFNDAQEPAFKKYTERFEEWLRQKPGKRRHGSARKQAAKSLKKEVRALRTSLQQMKEYPKDLSHPTISDIDGSITYLLHGTHPLAIQPILCSGLRAGKSGLFGGAVYLADKTAKIDQYTADDCEKNQRGDCEYVTEGMPSETKNTRGVAEPGFPAPELPNGDYDRSKPVHYCLVIMTSPYRITRDYAIRNGRGRRNEKQLFWNKGARKWQDFPFNFTSQTFDLPGDKPRRPLFDKFQFVHALSKVGHPDDAKEIEKMFPRWRPILDRMDEYFLRDPEYTRVEYVIAYQRK